MSHFLSNLPYTEIEAALASEKRVMAILPVGATESHGPHLPLSTDVIISEGIAKRCAQILENKGMRAFILPSLAYTPAEYASDFAGTISLSVQAMSLTLDDIGRALTKQGYACLAIANSHYDPANVTTLRNATKRISQSGMSVAFADATRRKLAEALTDEFKSGDCHGGQYETSIVLAERPELVNTDAMGQLPDVDAGLVKAISDGQDASFKSLGMSQSYCGSPSGASAKEGEQSLQILADALCEQIVETLS